MLHEGDNLDDFKPPFVVHSLHMGNNGKSYLLPGHLDAILLLLDAVHCLLGHILGMDDVSLRSSPVVNYVGISYSLVILAKILLAASDPASGLVTLISIEDLKFDSFLDKLQMKLLSAWGPGKCELAGKYLRIVQSTKTWYQKQETIGSAPLVQPDPLQQQQLQETQQVDMFTQALHIQNSTELPFTFTGLEDSFWNRDGGNFDSSIDNQDNFGMELDPSLGSLFPDLINPCLSDSKAEGRM